MAEPVEATFPWNSQVGSKRTLKKNSLRAVLLRSFTFARKDMHFPTCALRSLPTKKV